MGLVWKVIRWLSIAVLGISGLALMVAPALAQRELHAARGLDPNYVVGLPEAQTTVAVSAGSATSLNPAGSEATAGSNATTPSLSNTAPGGRGGLAQPRGQEPGVGSVGDLLGLALLILGLAVALYSQPRPRVEYTAHQ